MSGWRQSLSLEPKAGQTILQQRKHIEWIAIGVFAEVAPLVAAVRELASAGVSLADACLAGTPASMRRIASGQTNESPNL
jgi:hypothetical protein